MIFDIVALIDLWQNDRHIPQTILADRRWIFKQSIVHFDQFSSDAAADFVLTPIGACDYCQCGCWLQIHASLLAFARDFILAAVTIAYIKIDGGDFALNSHMRAVQTNQTNAIRMEQYRMHFIDVIVAQMVIFGEESIDNRRIICLKFCCYAWHFATTNHLFL